MADPVHSGGRNGSSMKRRRNFPIRRSKPIPGRVHVNLFETAVAQATGMPAQTCTQAEFCGKAVAIEHDGAVYSCDHFVYPDYALGDIGTTHLGNLVFSKPQERFGRAKSGTLPGKCRRYAYLKLCHGECPKHRLIRTAEGEAGLNYLCCGLWAFYDHIGPDVVAILKRLN